MERPYEGLRTTEIEALFEARRADPDYLQGLVFELALRPDTSARKLLAKLAAHLATLEGEGEPEAPVSEKQESAETSRETTATTAKPFPEGPPREQVSTPGHAELPVVGSLHVFDDLIRDHWDEPFVLESLREQLAGRREPEAQPYLGRIAARLQVLSARASALGDSTSITADAPELEKISAGKTDRDVPLARVHSGLPLHELRELFIRCWDRPDELHEIQEELEHREGVEVQSLRIHVQERLGELEQGPEPALPEELRADVDEPDALVFIEEPEPSALTVEGTSSGLTALEEEAPSDDGELRDQLRPSGPVPRRWWRARSPRDTGLVDTSGWEIEDPQLGLLRAAASDDEHEVHLAACEWDLDPAILIHSAEDIQARKHWQDTLEPFEHQVKNLITFCRRAPVALFADDVGLGKTISAGLVLSELIARAKVRRALILVPKVVLLNQWKEELEEKFGLRSYYATGVELDQYLRRDPEILITTYDSARNRIEQLAKVGFDMVIMDEAHKLRNLYGTASPPKIAERIRQALSERAFRYVLMLTATPIQNRLWDLYSLVDLLTTAKGHENPFGSQESFVRRYLADGKNEARQLHPGRRDEFRRILSQYMVRTRRAEANLEFPARHVYLEPARGAEGEQQLSELVGSFIGDLNPLAQSSLAQALMSSPEALVAQLANMAESGSVARSSYEAAREIQATVTRTGKADLLLELLRKLQSERPGDWRVVVFTGRKETQNAIGRFIEAELGTEIVGFIRGGDHVGNLRTTQGYAADPPTINVIVSTESGSEGLNLQSGNVIVNYDLPWNPMILEQRIGRVQRLGSKHASVIVLNLVLGGSVEEHVVGKLSEKLAAIASTLGDIEGILESLPEDQGDGASMEKRIREMVVSSLAGMDVEGSLRRMQESIDRAKRIYEDEKRTVEHHLGRLDEMHDAGPRMPALSSLEPRMSEKEFVRRGLRASGGELVDLGDGRWRYTIAGYPPEEVVFSREDLERHRPSGFAGGPRVSLYLPGQPAFEKLGERWRNSAHHAIRDLRGDRDALVRAVVEDWSRQFGESLSVSEFQVSEDQAAFVGEFILRTAVSVAHDKYEKLIEVPFVPEGLELAQAGSLDRAPLVDEDLSLADVLVEDQELTSVLRGSLDRDTDVRDFAGFYVRRLAEEREKAGDDEDLLALHDQCFTPRVSSKVVGAKGALFEIVDVDLSLTIDGVDAGTASIRCIPGSRAILEAPSIEACAVTGQQVPSSCLETCSVSGIRAIRSEMVQSERSARFGLLHHSRRCESSDRVLLEDEVAVCAITGKTADKELLVRSGVSGKLGLEQEILTCHFTGVRLLPEEAGTSLISGRAYRLDEEVEGGANAVRGHRSEFHRCAESGALLPELDLAVSDVSDRLVDERLMVESAKSGRRGAPSEMVQCESTGALLARDEVSTCAATGMTVDRDLLEESEVSGRSALPGMMVMCEESGRSMLPDEGGRCSVTNRLVDQGLLEKSAVSDKRALKSALETCSVTNKRVLPSELGTCEVTGRRALHEQLCRCSVTNKNVLLEDTVPNALAGGERINRESAGFSEHSGRATNAALLTRCGWDGRARLPDEVKLCALSGVPVGVEFLDDEGNLEPLADLLRRCELRDGPGDSMSVEAIPHMEVPGVGDVRRMKAFRFVASPTGHSRAVGGWRHRLLGIRTQRVAFLLTDGRIVGRVAVH